MSLDLPAAEERYELVVGLEVHAQLNTASKLFCGDPVAFGGEPNQRTSPLSLGLPGELPVLNQEAVYKVAALALAFESELAPELVFERKHYFYPDLPKGYQISQLRQNLGQGGRLQLLRSGAWIGVDNVHLEEDAGKLIHLPGGQGSRVDYNRAGTPLAEIVTRPDLRSVAQVDECMETLTCLLQALEVCACRMQEGNLRFEASISVRPRGQAALGARTEIKNLNSYSAVRRGVAYEFARQVALLEAGRTPRQETRLWEEGWQPGDAAEFEAELPPAARAELARVQALLPRQKDGWRGRTRFMRGKEDAHDYRYLPEPDLPPLPLDPARIAALRAAQPELPGARRQRYVEALGLEQRAAEALTRARPLAALFAGLLDLDVPASAAANLILNQVAALLNARGLSASQFPLPLEHLAELHALMAELPKDVVLKQVWPPVAEEGISPRALVAREGIRALDPAALDAATDAAWLANPTAVASLRAGRQKAAGAILGAVMRATRGQADPARVRARIAQLLAGAKPAPGE